MNRPYKHVLADRRTDNMPFSGAAPGTIVILSGIGELGGPVHCAA